MRVTGVAGIVLGAVIFGACGGGADGPPVGPAVLACPTAAVPLCTDAARATIVRAALSDAVTRLRPSLGTAAGAAVTAELSTLKAAVDAGSVGSGRSSADRLRAILATARGNATLTPDLATLDAITLAIIAVQSALGVTPAQLAINSSDASATI